MRGPTAIQTQPCSPNALWWGLVRRSTQIHALIAMLIMALAAVLLIGDANGCVIPLAVGGIALTILALQANSLGLALLNGLYSAYLVITVLCYFHYIDIYLLESLTDQSSFQFGMPILVCAQIIFNYQLLLRRPNHPTDHRRDESDDWIEDATMLLFGGMALALALYGYALYGGFTAFLQTPYDPIFEGSAESDYKHVIISTAGVLNTSIFCYAFQKVLQNKRRALFALVALLLFFIQVTFLIQGKREYAVETAVAASILLILCKSSGPRKITSKLFTLVPALLIGLALAGIGFVLRTNNTVDIFQLFQLAVGYEAQFTVATFFNVVFVERHYSIGYDYFKDLFQLFLIMVPRDLFALFDLDKDSLIPASNFAIAYVENKGGQFIFSSAYSCFGAMGVLTYALVLGRLLTFIDSSFVRRRPWIYAVATTYLWVLIRKDFVLAFKYYFTGIITIAVALMVAKALVRRFLGGRTPLPRDF